MTIDAAGVTTIGTGKVTTDKIADAAVTTAKIADGAVTEPKISGLIATTVSIDLPSIAGGATVNVDVAVAGLTLSHCVVAICHGDLVHGLVPIAAYVPAAGTLRVRITNFTAAAIDDVARTWFVWAYIP